MKSKKKIIKFHGRNMIKKWLVMKTKHFDVMCVSNFQLSRSFCLYHIYINYIHLVPSWPRNIDKKYSLKQKRKKNRRKVFCVNFPIIFFFCVCYIVTLCKMVKIKFIKKIENQKKKQHNNNICTLRNIIQLFIK